MPCRHDHQWYHLWTGRQVGPLPCKRQALPFCLPRVDLALNKPPIPCLSTCQVDFLNCLDITQSVGSHKEKILSLLQVCNTGPTQSHAGLRVPPGEDRPAGLAVVLSWYVSPFLWPGVVVVGQPDPPQTEGQGNSLLRLCWYSHRQGLQPRQWVPRLAGHKVSGCSGPVSCCNHILSFGKGLHSLRHRYWLKYDYEKGRCPELKSCTPDGPMFLQFLILCTRQRAILLSMS